MGGFLVEVPASLQGFQSRCSGLHQGTRVKIGAKRGRMHAPSATDATPLVLFVPGLAMDTLHIKSVFEAALPAAATIGFPTVPLEY